MDSSFPSILTGGTLPVIILGSMVQIAMLGLWHGIRPWSIVLIRTTISQVLVCLAAVVLTQRWPFSFPATYAGFALPFVFTEGFLVLWYLIQPRTNRHLQVDGERYDNEESP